MSPLRIIVIGGGITGLAAAWRAKELAPAASVSVWEEKNRWGGVLFTEQTADYLVEHSADNFLVQEPWVSDFARRTGFIQELIPTNAGNRRASVLFQGKLVEVPEGFVLMSPRALWPMLRTPLLSWRAKLRLLGELFVETRSGTEQDESLASFAKRRFGREVFDRLIQPLIGGIYTADPERLSLAATLPRFLEQERAYGSLLRAALEEQATTQSATATNRASGARYHQFLAPRHGMSSWIQHLILRLEQQQVTLRLQQRVSNLQLLPNRQWSVTAATQQSPGTHWQPLTATFDRVIITTPAPATARMLATVDAGLSHELQQIEYAGSSVVVVAVSRDQLSVQPTGFGMVVPAVERRGILAVSYSSEKFPGRAPADQLLLRVFVGGALQPELAELPDDQLLDLVLGELRSIYGLRSPPRWHRIVRWNRAMPQYHLGHLERVARIEKLTANCPGLALAGAAYRGVGIPQCIHSGELAAERVLG